MKKRIILLAALVLCLVLPLTALAEYAFVQLGAAAHVSPDATSSIVANYNAGTWVELAEDGMMQATEYIEVIGPDGVPGFVPAQSLFIPSQVPAAQTIVVANKGKFVNLRAGASTSTSILAQINDGTPMQLIETGKSFHHVLVGGIEGYMSSKFTKTGRGTINTLKVTSSNGKSVNMRSEPSMNGDILTSVPNGKSVNVIMLGGGWSYIKYQNVEGFMMSKFLKSGSAPIPGPVPNPNPDSDFYETGIYRYVSNGSRSVRYRKGPGDNGAVMGKLYSGDEVYEISTNGSWSKIRFTVDGKTKTAYMMSRYLVSILFD